jgi:hypothetical protein
MIPNLIRYDRYCNTTAPSEIAPLGVIPFNEFATCLPALASVNCPNDYGFEQIESWEQSVKPTGTGSLTNLGGIMTSPVSGPTLLWSLYSGGAVMTAVAVPFHSIATTGAGATKSSAGAASGTSGNAATGTQKSSNAGTLQDVSRGQVMALVGLLFALVLL